MAEGTQEFSDNRLRSPAPSVSLSERLQRGLHPSDAVGADGVQAAQVDPGRAGEVLAAARTELGVERHFDRS